MVSISNSNSKMGAGVFSVSLSRCSCDPAAPCFKKCYANHLKRFTSCEKAYFNNYTEYKTNPAAYFAEISKACKFISFFRWHVVGDIVDSEYFAGVVDVAKENKKCDFLIFTKKYNIVNAFIDNGDKIPKNLHVIFSAWGDVLRPVNPHRFPVAEIVFKGEQPRPEWKTCGGCCSDCACRGCGCWNLKKGETIFFNEH